MIDKFNEWFEGTFENKKQAFGRPAFYSYVQLRHLKLDNGFFYGEQQNMWKDFPYRQFAVKPFLDGDNIVIKNYEIDKDLHLGFKNLDQITESNLEYKVGCDNIISFEGSEFVGGIQGCDCYVEWEGHDTYVVNSMILGDGYYNVYDKGIDVETKKRLWGSAYSHYNFIKTSSEAVH